MNNITNEPRIESLEDGTQIIHYTGSKTIVYSDGRVESKLDVGHVIEMSDAGITLTINWSALKCIGLDNINDIKSVIAMDDNNLIKTEVVFKNNSKFFCWHDHHGSPAQMQFEGGSRLEFTQDGERVTIKQPEQYSDVAVK